MIRHTRRSKACDRCRARKVKCDEFTPECSRCRKAGVPCPGPVRGSIFVHNQPRHDRVVQGAAAIPPRTPQSPQLPATGDQGFTGLLSTTAAKPHGIPSPLCDLGQGRVDPFIVMARRTIPRENFLLDFYVSDIISSFGGNPYAKFHPSRDACFNVAIQGLASIDCALSFAAGHLARKTGQPDTEERMYKLSSVQLLNEALSDPSQRFHSSTIITILGSLNILTQQGSRPFSSEEQREIGLHVQGVRYLIHKRGGYIAFCNDPSMSWMTAYNDILVFGEISAGCTPLSTHALSPSESILPVLTSRCSSASGPYTYSPQLLAREYIGAIHNFFSEAQRRRHNINMAGMASADEGCIEVSRLFRPQTPISQLLANPTQIALNASIAVLFLLNIVLWDYRHDLLSAFNGYFRKIRHFMVDEGLDLGGTMDRFCWILFTNPETHQIDRPDLERLWLLGRLLRIHAMISRHLQVEVETRLLHFLVSEDEDENLCSTLEKFHSDVMSNLGYL